MNAEGSGSRQIGASERPAPESAPSATELELYKLAVEMIDRLSARRAAANTFFLTVNTGLAALLGSKTLRWYAAVAGIVFALTWWSLLRTYRQLSQVRFKVLNEFETRLPLRFFTAEWERVNVMRRPAKMWPPGRLWAWMRGYHDLGTSERIVPLAFVAIYIAELVRQAAG